MNNTLKWVLTIVYPKEFMHILLCDIYKTNAAVCHMYTFLLDTFVTIDPSLFFSFIHFPYLLYSHVQ